MSRSFDSSAGSVYRYWNVVYVPLEGCYLNVSTTRKILVLDGRRAGSLDYFFIGSMFDVDSVLVSQ